MYDEYKPLMGVNDDVRRAAAAAVGDASTPDQKLERIFEFCRSKIKNTDSESSGLSREEQQSIELACINAKTEGPAIYNRFLENQLDALGSYHR